MTNKEQLDELLLNKTTPEVARDLLGMYLEYVTPTGTVGGYIVDAEAYLGPEDEAAHSFGMRAEPHEWQRCMKSQERFIFIRCTPTVF